MEELNYEGVGISEEVKENIPAGIIGALLCSLGGVILWIVIGMFGYIASISAIAILAGAIKGYRIFAKQISVKGIVISCIISFVMVFVAVNASYIAAAISEWGMDAVNRAGIINVIAEFWNVVEIRTLILKDLAIGYLFFIVYGVMYIRRKAF